MTLAITPTSATNRLRISVVCQLHCSAAIYIVTALFQDSTANALAAGTVYPGLATQIPALITLKYTMTAGTTSATTFKVRGGSNVAGTTTFNGSGGAGLFNGTFFSSIIITETTS